MQEYTEKWTHAYVYIHVWLLFIQRQIVVYMEGVLE